MTLTPVTLTPMTLTPVALTQGPCPQWRWQHFVHFVLYIFFCIFTNIINFSIFSEELNQKVSAIFTQFKKQISKCPCISKHLPHVLSLRMAEKSVQKAHSFSQFPWNTLYNAPLTLFDIPNRLSFMRETNGPQWTRTTFGLKKIYRSWDLCFWKPYCFTITET